MHELGGEYFSRLRRAESGHHHHIAGPYLLRYAQEASWREDNRRVSNGERDTPIAGLAMHKHISPDFHGVLAAAPRRLTADRVLACLASWPCRHRKTFLTELAGNGLDTERSHYGFWTDFVKRELQAMELRMQVDDEFIKTLQAKLDLPRATDIVREALTILNWAIVERERNRVILSADTNGQNVERLAMPVLDRLAR